MHTCIINKRSIDPRLNHQRFKYHITRLKKTREEQLMVFFFFLYSELFYVTTGERDKYTKTSQTKNLKLQLKVLIYLCLFYTIRLKQMFRKNLKSSSTRIIWCYSIGNNLYEEAEHMNSLGDLYNRECSISIFIINLLSKICQSLHD